MQNKNTLKAGLLSPEVRELLNVSPYAQVVVVIENNDVKIKSQLQNAFEELNKVVKDDLKEAGIDDEDSALEYFYKFRHGDN